jgi:cytoskeletal protein RodZ
MIGWRQPPSDGHGTEPRGFDDFDLRIGDVMRGERATMGKSLLDVQRELKIKATYIAAIENADIAAFETSGFIAGYVRSYARYLGLDPEWTFETFCAESGFAPVTGMEKPGPAKGQARTHVTGPVFRKPARAVEGERDPIVQPRVSFAPAERSPLSAIEPRAIGSTLVLVALIGAIGFGGWSVVKEVQRVTVAPVDQAPEAIAQVDPLEGVRFEAGDTAPDRSGVSAGRPDALDRLYRPEALDVPVMVPRDGPIAALDPRERGALAGAGMSVPEPARPDPLGAAADDSPAPGAQQGAIAAAVAEATGLAEQAPEAAAPDRQTPRVTADMPDVMLVAVRPAWVRVRAADGTVLLERILEPGDSWEVPATEEPPTLRTGAAGAVFFAVNGQTYGPAGPNGAVVDQIALTGDALSRDFALADPESSPDAREAVAVAEAALARTGAPDPLSQDAPAE